jgi:hypothetical protein
MPRPAAIQPHGANPFHRSLGENRAAVTRDAGDNRVRIRIGDPISFDKAVKTIRETNGGRGSD